MPLDPVKVYETAQSLLPAAMAFLRRTGLDPKLAEDLMMQIVINVLETKISSEPPIKNLAGYLYTSFKHMALEEFRRYQRYEDLSEEQFRSLSNQQADARKIEREIVKEQIVRHLNLKDRFILDQRLLDYSFKEISTMFQEKFGKPIAENVLRSRYHKILQRLEKELQK